MADQFSLKINIDTILSSRGGLDLLLKQVDALTANLRTLQSVGGSGLRFVSDADVAKTRTQLDNLNRLIDRNRIRMRSLQGAAAGAQEAAELARLTQLTDRANRRRLELETRLQQQLTAQQRMGEAQRLAQERRTLEQRVAMSREANARIAQSIENASARGIARVGGLEAAFGRLGPAIRTALAGLTAYMSFQGMKAMTTQILSMGANFEQTMLRVKAVTNSTEAQYTALTARAREVGAATEFTATQAAEGLQFLGMAGFQAEKAIAALPGTVNLATAGMIDLGTAADITTNVLTGMGLSVEELDRVNDVLVRTFTTSNTNLMELGEAFKYAAPSANAFGADIETVSVLLADLANAGIKGSMAGTSVANSFVKLGKVFNAYGVSAQTADGKSRGLIEALELLAKENATPNEIIKLFDVRAGRSMLALIDLEKKTPGILRSQVDAVRKEATGTTDRIADEIRGSFQNLGNVLKSVLEDIMLEAFTANLDLLKGALQGLITAVQNNASHLKGFSSGLIEIATSAIRAGDSFVKLLGWLKETGTLSGLANGAVVLLAASIGRSLIGALAGMVTRTQMGIGITRQLTAEMRTGFVASEQAAMAQRSLTAAYNAGLIPRRQYLALINQIITAQGRLQAVEAAQAAVRTRYERAQLILNQRLAQGTITAERHATAMLRLANAQAVAMGRATAAATASTVATAASVGAFARLGGAIRGASAGLLALAGGPWGLIIAGLVGVVFWFNKWKASMDEARNKIIELQKEAVERSKSILEVSKQLNKLEEREKEQGGPTKDTEEERERLFEQAKNISPDLQLKGVITSLDVDKEAVKQLQEVTNSYYEAARAMAQTQTGELDKLRDAARKAKETLGGVNLSLAKKRTEIENTEDPLMKGLAKLEEKRLTQDYAKAIDEYKNAQKTLEKFTTQQTKNIQVEASKLRDSLARSFALGLIDEKQFESEIKKLAISYNDVIQGNLGVTPTINKEQFLADAFKMYEQFKGTAIEANKTVSESLDTIIKNNITKSAQMSETFSKVFSGNFFYEARKGFLELQKTLDDLKTSTEEALKPWEDTELKLKVKLQTEDNPEERAKIIAEIEKSQEMISIIHKNETKARMEYLAQFAAEVAVMEAEQLKGSQLSEKEKTEARKDGTAKWLDLIIEGETREIQAQVDTLTAVKKGCEAKIAELRALMDVAIATGSSELAAITVDMVKENIKSGEAGLRIEELKGLLATLRKDADDAMNRIRSGGGGGKGGGGGGKTKEPKDESVELAKIAAERAKFEAEQASKEIAEAFKRGDADVTQFLAQTVAARKQMYDADVAAAQAAVSKSAKGSEAERQRAQLDLDKAMAAGANSTKEAYEETFKAIETAYNDLISKIKSQSETIQLNVDMGMMSEGQGRDELKKLIEDNQPALDSLIDGMKQLNDAAEAAGLNMDFADRLTQAQAAAVQLKQPLNEIANNINGVIRNSITGMLGDIAAGSMTLGEALRNMLYNVAQGLAQIAAQQIASSVMSWFGGGSGGGIGGLLMGLGGFAEGGPINGPGTTTSDSILARLSKGEYVINAKAVKFWGPSLLEHLNKMRRLDLSALMPRFAEGGPVGLGNTINNNINNISKRFDNPSDSLKFDFTVQNSVDKDKLIETVVKSPQFSKYVQKSNHREQRMLRNSTG